MEDKRLIGLPRRPSLSARRTAQGGDLTRTRIEALERRTVGRKTPLDGRLEVSPDTSARVRALGEEFPVIASGREGRARVETLECTCGKSGSAGSHLHHFVAAPLFRELVPGETVRLELDERRGTLLVGAG